MLPLLSIGERMTGSQSRSARGDRNEVSYSRQLATELFMLCVAKKHTSTGTSEVVFRLRKFELY
jgi:hypothetical protein